MSRMVYEKTGGSNAVSSTYRIRSGVISATLKSDLAKGIDPFKKQVKPVAKRREYKYPLEVVLEARRLHEQEGLCYKNVIAQLEVHGYTICYQLVRSWCLYIQHRHDEVPPNAKPYLPLKTSASE